MSDEPHVSRTPCHRCGGTDAVIIRNGPHAEVRCATDNAHLYFAPKVEIGEVNVPFTIKPIETRYAGCRFRSRLEARWAVFFDALNIEWQYEPQGFELPSGRYLPDFYLPSLATWFEVKGKFQSGDKAELFAKELSDMTRERVIILAGDIPRHDELGAFKTDDYLMVQTCPDGSHAWDIQYWWCVCPVCLKPEITFNGRGARVCGSCVEGDKSYTYDHPIIVAAYEAARSARFEFGESGKAA